MTTTDTPAWFPDELAYAGEEHLDPAFVTGYDQKQATNPTEDITLLQGLGLDASSTLVDLGAGTGNFALAVAPHCGRVVAVDVSPQMIDYMRDQATASGIENIEYVQAGFLSYQHRGEPADIVYSRNALHHLSDFWKAIALERIATMLKPDGLFFLRDLVYSFDTSEAESVFEAWFDNAVSSPTSGYTREDLATHVKTEYSTFSWLLEPILERAGFEIQDIDHRGSRTYSAYTCVKAQ